MEDAFNKLYRDLSFGILSITDPTTIRKLRRRVNLNSPTGCEDVPEIDSLPKWNWYPYSDHGSKINYHYPYNIIDTGSGIMIEVAVIGLDITDIDMELEGSVLRIKHTKPEEDVNYIYKKITNKSFELAWTLSNSLDLTTLSANLDKGLLSITLGLKPAASKQKITITETEDA